MPFFFCAADPEGFSRIVICFLSHVYLREGEKKLREKKIGDQIIIFFCFSCLHSYETLSSVSSSH